MSKSSTDRTFMAEALKRFEAARSGWQDIRKAANIDLRAVNVTGGQWDTDIRLKREKAGRPVLEANELHTYVQRIVNTARKDRPQPKVSPGDDDATEEAAEFLEDRLRHIANASQADVAYDTAVDSAAGGGFGFFEITKEYADNGARKGTPSMNQEPRIKRILDPMTQYPDPAAQEPDFSDARYWFSRDWMSREAFKARFHADPISFDSEASTEEWSRDDQVCVARYWVVEETSRRYVALKDGTEDFADKLGDVDPESIVNEREVIQRKVVCHLIDGEKKLSTDTWEGQWIPIIPVLGREIVVDGKRHLLSAVRFAVDPQKVKNSYFSNIAGVNQNSPLSPWLGPKGMFKDPRWQSANSENFSALEWDPVTGANGNAISPNGPTRNTYEAPIQSLTAGFLQANDEVKRCIGYSDAVSAPSRTQLSGIAVQKRTDQADLTNFHFEDNLVRSQQHCARVVIDLDLALADTPRMLKGRGKDGQTVSRPITMADEDGQLQHVPGQDPAKHIRLDVGRYDVTIVSAPAYATKAEEELAEISALVTADPQMLPLYIDIIFNLKGQHELEERAKLVAPPQVQAAIAAKSGNADPAVLQQQNTALKGQLQQLQQAMQQVTQIIKTKQVEGQNKIAAIQAQGSVDIEKKKLDAIEALMTAQQQHTHEATGQLAGHHFDAAAHMADLFHQTGTAAAQADQQQQQAEMAQQQQQETGE